MIVKEGTAILTVPEFDRLLEAAGKQGNRVNLKCMLYMGCRYVEAQYLQSHLECFDKNFIFLPKVAQKKVKRTIPERHIRLSTAAKELVPFFFTNIRLPSGQGWLKNMKRWAEWAGLDPGPVNVKTTRKTYESWLVYYYRNVPRSDLFIFQSQGHTRMVSVEHYLNMPFTPTDELLMRPYVEGYL